MLEGQIRRLMVRMEEFENERKKEEGWRMARFEWLSGMDKGSGSRLRSRIGWMEARKQQGSEQSNLRTSGDLVGVQERGPGSSWENQFM